ncbi:hypothetical protein GCK32_013988 [Trichostrongylus colubriformis]|uniref:Uncharacterized protein n=1 Tax=Trichostrongylus colubriformis TaxID=6319 RepID=A0AAN8FM40_TRICO
MTALLFAIIVRGCANVRDDEKMKELISTAGGRLDLRIILDSEKAAIKAATKCFPSASVKGCELIRPRLGIEKEMRLGCAQR